MTTVLLVDGAGSMVEVALFAGGQKKSVRLLCPSWRDGPFRFIVPCLSKTFASDTEKN